MELTKELMKPEHALALIHLGYNPDEAATQGTDDLAKLVEVNFRKPESPAIIFNHGGTLDIEMPYPLDGPANPTRNKTQLSTFALFTEPVFKCIEGSPFLYITTINIGYNSENSYGIGIKDTTFRGMTAEGLSTLDIRLVGRTSMMIKIWPFSDDSLPDTVIVPYLPVEKRDEKYWQHLAEYCGFELGEVNSDEDSSMKRYIQETPNENLTNLMLSSDTWNPSGKLWIEATFKENISKESAEEFKKYASLFKGPASVMMGQNTVYGRMPKGFNYLATGLVKTICEHGKE